MVCPRAKMCSTSSSRHSRSWVRTKFTIRSSGADLTVREESKEFLRRLETGENLPLMTSCCPSWVRYVEQERPQFIKNLSSALSPMQMFATVLKDKYREKDAADGRTTFHIAIMPCTAKKMEAGREEFRRDGVPNVDLVLTTQEVIKMIKESGIRFQMLEKESPDLPFGMGSGAAEIFGTSGGVAEAVLRCCLPDKSKNVLRMLEHSGLRGTEAIRFVTIPVNGRDVRVALAHGPCQRGKAARSNRKRRGRGRPGRGHVLPHRLRRRRGPALRADEHQAQARPTACTRSTAARCSSAASATPSSTRCMPRVSMSARTSCCTTSTRTDPLHKKPAVCPRPTFSPDSLFFIMRLLTN